MQGLFWILLFYLLGRVIAHYTGDPLPGSIIGMLLLFAALSLKWLDPKRVKKTATFLLDHLILFFIPVGVGVMATYNVIGAHITAIITATVVSTLLVLISVGWVVQWMERRRAESKKLERGGEES